MFKNLEKMAFRGKKYLPLKSFNDPFKRKNERSCYTRIGPCTSVEVKIEYEQHSNQQVISII